MEFTTRQVAELSGASFRQLDYWDRTGTFRPSIRTPNGSGSRRRYSADDVTRARILADLADAGAPRRVLTGVLRFLEHPQHAWPDTLTVSADGRALLTDLPSTPGAFFTMSPARYAAATLLAVSQPAA